MNHRDRYDEMGRMRDRGISYFKIGLHFGMSGNAAQEILSGARPERKAPGPALSAPVRIAFVESPALKEADSEKFSFEFFECPCGRCRALKPKDRRNIAAIIPKQ